MLLWGDQRGASSLSAMPLKTDLHSSHAEHWCPAKNRFLVRCSSLPQFLYNSTSQADFEISINLWAPRPKYVGNHHWYRINKNTGMSTKYRKDHLRLYLGSRCSLTYLTLFRCAPSETLRQARPDRRKTWGRPGQVVQFRFFLTFHLQLIL